MRRKKRSSSASERKRATGKGPASSAGGTLGEWLRYLGANLDESDWIPVWPPDAFAIASAFLRRTGAYVQLVNGGGTQRKAFWPSHQAPKEVGKQWREVLSATLRGGKGASGSRLREACPTEIKEWWQRLADSASRSVGDAASDPSTVSAACNLVVASDAASKGIGIALEEDPFLDLAQAILAKNDLRSFCLWIPADKLAVLGKQHTPQRGCTIRSLTHHLALYAPTEIYAYWVGPYLPAERDLDVFNLLLLPWPTEVATADFSVAARNRSSGDPRIHRYFDYQPSVVGKPAEIAKRVEEALRGAKRYADQIHGIVFPEVGLTLPEYMAVERVAISSRAMLVAGVRVPSTGDDAGAPLNMCVIQPLGLTGLGDDQLQRYNPLWDGMRRLQLKHHRWCLDRRQILQYELGGRLPASRDCWERIHIGDRKINFVTIGTWLTTCALICEDLARQDPVSDVIRAVGPNLVFALLMDGPQLRSRWPARYASVLAEDPGCSVLTMTSLGMARRSKPRLGGESVVDKSTTIGLWRDAIDGEHEIALERDHDACVLSLVCRTAEEFTIDGRGDDGAAQFPVFAGAYSFKV